MAVVRVVGGKYQMMARPIININNGKITQMKKQAIPFEIEYTQSKPLSQKEKKN